MTVEDTPKGHVRLGILLSGRGSNFISIADAIAAKTLQGCSIAVVVGNLPEAPGLDAARQRGLPAVCHRSRGVPREEHDRSMIATLREYAVDYVILAGYMRVLTPAFLQAFPDRVINIHPSLLPAFPGLHAQRQALEFGATVAGCTVHFVDEAVDHGVIILQRAVDVLPHDTERTLADRILQQEHLAYPEAISRVLSGAYRVHGRRYLPH